MLDFTRAELPDAGRDNPDAGDVVAMHRFNTLNFHVYELEPTELDIGQVAPPEATTYSTRTLAVIKALFNVWKPLGHGTELRSK